MWSRNTFISNFGRDARVQRTKPDQYSYAFSVFPSCLFSYLASFVPGMVELAPLCSFDTPQRAIIVSRIRHIPQQYEWPRDGGYLAVWPLATAHLRVRSAEYDFPTKCRPVRTPVHSAPTVLSAPTHNHHRCEDG